MKPKEVALAVTALSHTVGLHVKKVMALSLTYTSYFGSSCYYCNFINPLFDEMSVLTSHSSHVHIS